MPKFILSLNWTDQGIRAIKDAPARSQAAKELAAKVGMEIQDVYLTTGDHDLIVIAEAADGDAVAKFAMAVGSLGNVRTSIARAWTEPELIKLRVAGMVLTFTSLITGALTNLGLGSITSLISG